MNNVYYVGSGELTFDIIERIINENLKLELAPEAKLRIQRCRDYLDQKIAASDMVLLPALVPCVARIFLLMNSVRCKRISSKVTLVA